MKRMILKTVISSLAVASLVAIGQADIRACMQQFSFSGDGRHFGEFGYYPSNCGTFMNQFGAVNISGNNEYAQTCVPHLYDCIQAEINAGTQNAINNVNPQITDLKNLHNVDTSHIVDRFNQDEAIINNNHNNVLAQIQATNNSIAAIVTNTVNQQLPTQVSQNLPQVVQSQLTPDLIAKGLQSQYQTALNTKFKTNSGALYIRGFETTVDMDGQQLLNVYPVDTEHNFCAGTTSAEKLYATLYLTQKNASVIAAYLLSAYATGKPVVLETSSYTTEGNYHCVIKNINASADINSLKA